MKGPEMLKYLLAAAALLVAGVPAYLGLTSNASFSRDVPVRVPEQAQVVSPTRAAAPTSTPTRTAGTNDDGTPDQGRGEVEAGDDHGDVPRDDRTEIGDDHGGDVPRDDRTEAGDDRDATSGSDDTGSHSGSDDSGSDDSGHGSDDGPDHD
jgi:hypothetical protein